ncbi:STN domain-containing protein [Pandoraea sputorum]|uniref:STN domain-containing protein n=1 Tax=Pandoraea sputorum TaxID=93222 RepID=UPI001241E175|nr:STN domain-containing protein [Pandoraea sputorum]VVE82438.1 Ferripyoverdine receptor [Pandoraea sputorum]
MRKSPAGVSWLAGVLALGWLACLLFGPAAIARTDAREAQPFDIPELPLKDALARFDTLTRMSVFYPSSLVEGRRSHAVSGIRAPHEALDEMLSGTGVTAERTAEDAFVLAPVNSPVSQDSSRGEANVAGSYLATLQNVVLRALCAQPSLSPGVYRLAMTVQVGANARVSRVRLLDTTGDARRDTTIVQRLQGLDVGRAPSDTTRPFVILVLPTGCRTGHVACVQSPCQAMTEH